MLDELVGDVCPDCRHSLRDDLTCPSCGWQRRRVDATELPPYEPDDLPSIRGW